MEATPAGAAVVRLRPACYLHRMQDDVAQLILAQLRGLRQEFAVATGAATSALHATQKVAVKLDRMAAELGRLREELGAVRADGRGALLSFERDLLAAERQNVSRHGETLSVLWSMGDLERRTAALERQIAG